MTPASRIEKILIHPDVRDLPLTRRILANAPDIPSEISAHTPDLPLAEGKKLLFLTASSGTLVKPCPATNPPYLCCRYTVIQSCTQCPMDCTYCVLQNYLESPVITLNMRIDDIYEEIDLQLAAAPGRFFRFGTGELGDSLVLDPLTGLSEDFISFFRGKRNALIELKTKSVSVGRVLRQEAGSTVLSWSVNPDRVVRSQEIFAPPLHERLAAAKSCQEAGYLLGFHFDPVIRIPDGERLYSETVDRIFETVDPERVAWISLGSLRFPPALKSVIQSRFPGNRLVYEEMIRGMDGKMRYPGPMRIELYQSLVERIRSVSGNIFLYFCMESPRVWQRVFGFAPLDNADLDFRFAENLWRRFRSDLNMDKPEPRFYRD